MTWLLEKSKLGTWPDPTTSDKWYNTNKVVKMWLSLVKNVNTLVDMQQFTKRAWFT